MRENWEWPEQKLVAYPLLPLARHDNGVLDDMLAILGAYVGVRVECRHASLYDQVCECGGVWICAGRRLPEA